MRISRRQEDGDALCATHLQTYVCQVVIALFKVLLDKPGVNTGNVKYTAEMSRNDGKKDTSASAFRKIDVDQYSDNNFKEEDADGGVGVPTGPDENEILTLLSQYPFVKRSRTPRGSLVFQQLRPRVFSLTICLRVRTRRRLYRC